MNTPKTTNYEHFITGDSRFLHTCYTEDNRDPNSCGCRLPCGLCCLFPDRPKPCWDGTTDENGIIMECPYKERNLVKDGMYYVCQPVLINKTPEREEEVARKLKLRDEILRNGPLTRLSELEDI